MYTISRTKVHTFLIFIIETDKVFRTFVEEKYAPDIGKGSKSNSRCMFEGKVQKFGYLCYSYM